MNAPYYEAPPGLEDRIRQSLRRETPAPAVRRWLALAAAVLLTASLAVNIALLRSRTDPREPTATAVLSAHLRSLAGTHLLDVLSSDRHSVKPWFNGKLDFAPPVKSLDGFPLLGGRLEYLDGHPAAALVYGRDKHIINVLVWPAAPQAETAQTRNGYRLDNWSEDGMTFWAVSDLNEAELRRFIALFRGTKPAG